MAYSEVWSSCIRDFPLLKYWLGQNIVNGSDTFIVVIVSRKTLWNKHLVRTTGIFGKFEKLFNFDST